MNVPVEPFLDRKALADRWGMSDRTLETWSREGRGPVCKRFGKRAMYRLADVQKYEEKVFTGKGKRA
jgi:predicted site-specific integrase-resolvase